MILLNFDTAIKGDSTVPGHEDWITCDSLQFGVGRSINMSGGGKDRETSNPSFSEFTLSKSTDAASPELFFQAICGKSLGKAHVHFVQQAGAGEDPQIYLTYELDGAIVSSYSISSGGDRPTESVAVSFTKITKKYDAFDGSKRTTGTAKKWDLMANKTF